MAQPIYSMMEGLSTFKNADEAKFTHIITSLSKLFFKLSYT